MTKIVTLENYEDSKFKQAYAMYYKDLGISDFKYWDRLFADMVKEEDFKTFLLFDANELIGFIQCQAIELKHWFFNEHLGFIREIWILSKARHKGNGEILLNYAMEHFKKNGLKKMIITSEKVDSFFSKHGFSIDPSYKAMNQDTVMVKLLDES